MKLSSLLTAAVALALADCATISPPQDQAVADQLLHTLGQFNSADPLIAELETGIEQLRSAHLLDGPTGAIAQRSILSPTDRSRLACRMLQCVLNKHYTDATNQTAYDTLRLKNWSNNCDLPAACFLTPVHPAQVAVALQIINITQSKFASRSGGHNPNPGFAGVGAEGVTIDLQGFTALQLSADKSVATVGAGLRFGAVQTYLDQRGVAVVSGRNKDVGVSGLLLGGGHPIINSLTGLAADNIQSAEVVLSDFRVVTASQTENSDLFRALKGGSGNFGIVTSFNLKTSMPRSIWYRNVVYSSANARAVFDAFVAVQRGMENDPMAGIQMTCSTVGFTVAFVYGKPTNDPEVFAPFRGLTPVNETQPPTNGTTLGFITLQSPPQAEASRDTVGVTTYPNTDLYVDIYNKWVSAVTNANSPTTMFALPIQTYGSGAVLAANRNGGNVLGTSATAQTWWNPIAQWANPADDAKIHKTLIDMADTITKSAQNAGFYDRYIFANIAAREQKVLASYGQDNLNFMKSVSRKYDTTGMFQKLQNGGFLLSRA